MPAQVDDTTALDERVRAELLPDLEVVRSLGTGATANVYLARETGLQRLVAVKVLRPSVAADDVLRQRFEREAQSAARITHPHVTAIHRIGRLRDGVPYIVMEYVEGRTLADVIDSGVQMDATQSRAVLAGIASALAAAHDHGIVHRDVRPGNVLVDRHGRAVLGDFGIAALLESGASTNARLTAVGVRLGDPRYLSPEQIRGEPVVEQSDVYSFGILACELLTGAHPFEALTTTQMIIAHTQQEPRKLRDIRTTVDPAVSAIIERCLAKDANKRPLAREIASRLQDTHTAEEPVSGGPVEQFVNELKRRRVYQVLAYYGGLAIALLSMAGVFNQSKLLSDAGLKRALVSILIGFPVVLVMSWLYDIRPGAIERTRSAEFTRPVKLLIWGGLALVVGGALLLTWLMLKGPA